MSIVWHQNSDSRQQKFISNIPFTASTTFTYGQALIVSAATGAWVTAAAGGPVGGIYNGPTTTTPASPAVYPEVIEARPGDEFEVDYSGVPDAAFKAGQSTADLDGTATGINAADIVGGPFAILSVNTAKSKVIARIKNRQFS